MKDNEKNSKKRGLIAVIIVLCLVIVCAAGYLVMRYLGVIETKEDLLDTVPESLASDRNGGTIPPEKQDLTMPSLPPATEAPTTATVPTTTNPPTVIHEDEPVDFEGLMAINDDVYSWIYVPDTNISYPVAQSMLDDNFYLDHDVYKDYSFPGAIYSQSMNSRDYLDRVTVLYGHNMNNGSMFANLHYFSDDSFFNTHRYFFVYTKDRTLTYEVVSAFDYDNQHILNSYNFDDDKVFSEWLEFSKNPRSVYCNVNQDVSLDLNSKMLVLSTCMNGGDGRFLVQGVLVNDERTQ